MKKFIAYLLLGALFGMIPPPLPAQQNQNQETEALKKRVSELEKQLQTVENIEKLDLQAKLADANAKLANAEFGKFERELRDSNDKWLGTWNQRFLRIIGVCIGIIAVFVAILFGVSRVFWFWLQSRANQLIADEVEKNLNGFKVAVEEQDVIKNELRVLEKAHTASVLEPYYGSRLDEQHFHPEEVKALREEVLLDVFKDRKYDLVTIRHQAAQVLAARKSTRLVPPTLEFLNSVVDSDSDIDFETGNTLHDFVRLLRRIYTPETYEGLTKFLNRLLTENPKHKDLFLMRTVFSLARVSIQLDRRDSVPILIRAMSHFEHPGHEDLGNLAEYFDIFNEPEGIKEILTNHVTSEASGMEDVEEKCLELLQKHDPEFVEQWRASETTENST